MNILDHVRTHIQREKRLTDAQMVHLQSRAYRGVKVATPRPKSIITTIDGKRYSCLPLD